ncbi:MULTISPECIES: transglycosylase domain-containing protein [unclassified Arthrobacter]|uniref:transglycosylase domain-containing protein n=1 Tax=unclassified Arthrobacter TaxID=235627 RepID=UPI001E3FFBFF|nr:MULTISPECIES: transglycosylase domain-containing protein [unclassified Arthrobacter]MCC9145285.1 transglycosylase domain-containing protein [Arthrobacter sp. zg-Y919]MDK1276513.1 transglycosylase domain-containing protein [Arthrobacter sp. zg.Y919]WIB01893.1 transglycosylase domain-containing protein [Arthrobacter sp. zg-Y919]
MRPPKPSFFERLSVPGRLVAFFLVSLLAGVLAASTLIPMAAVAATGTDMAVGVLDQLPDELETGPLDEGSKIYSADGVLLATFYSQNRVPVKLDEMSQSMQDAIVSIEDARFFEHNGIDFTGVARAVASNAAGSDTQGASTLTMQYVNNVLISRDMADGKGGSDLTISGTKDLGDKLREAKLAVAVEKEYTKEEILEGYLNIVLFGGQTYGVEAAAHSFFGVTAADLTPAQSAMLAGMVQSPSHYNPFTNPEGTKDRRDTVLAAMLKNGKLTQAEYDQAVASGLDLNPQNVTSGCTGAEMAQYFCSYVEQTVLQSEAFGADVEERAKLLARGGLTIRTTLDSRLQSQAQKQIEAQVPVGDASGAGSAIVSVEPGTGKILAMAQNTEYTPELGKGKTQLNFNVDADMGGTPYGFQPGSTMKPFTTAAWLASGRGLNDTIDATRTSYPAGFKWKASCLGANAEFDEWKFKNASEGFEKKMTVAEGLTQSVNTATVAQAAQLDLCDIRDTATDMGVHRAVDGEPLEVTSPSFVLGGQEVAPLTMASAYATFASGGTYCEPTALTEVTDGRGNAYDVPGGECTQAIDADVAAAVTQPLQKLVEGSPGSIHPIGVPAAAKTGTTDMSEQTWTVGYTTGISTASWVGNWNSYSSLNNQSINGVTRSYVDGSAIAGAQWTDYMAAVAKLYDAKAFPAVPNRML